MKFIVHFSEFKIDKERRMLTLINPDGKMYQIPDAEFITPIGTGSTVFTIYNGAFERIGCISGPWIVLKGDRPGAAAIGLEPTNPITGIFFT